MMTVEHAVVRNSEVAVFLHIGNAVGAVLLVKSSFQIVIWFVDGLHNGIVDICSLNGNPAHKIVVLFIHRRIFLIGGLCGGFRFGFLRGSLRCFFLDQCRNGFKGFGTLFVINILPAEHKAGEKEKGGAKRRPRKYQFSFHR